MAAAILLLALLFRSCSWAADSKGTAPSFSADSIVNSANNSPMSLAPNVLATVFGTNLAYSAQTVSLEDIGAATLPTLLAGVRVTVAGYFAPLLYVSPTQVNFLIPANLLPGQTNITLVRDGTSSSTQITLLDVAPAVFVVDSQIAATHADGSLISPDAPATPGEVIVIYCTGLGKTNPDQLVGAVPRAAAPIILLNRLQVLLDGQGAPAGNILYAGITPGYPGLYQINLRVPMDVGPSPELRISMGDRTSQSALQLQVATPSP